MTNLYVLCGLVSQSCLTLVTAWTVACQAPLSMGLSRKEYWSGLSCPPPWGHPEPGIEPRSPKEAGRIFTIWANRDGPTETIQCIQSEEIKVKWSGAWGRCPNISSQLFAIFKLSQFSDPEVAGESRGWVPIRKCLELLLQVDMVMILLVLCQKDMMLYVGKLILWERENPDIVMILEHGVWVNINTEGPQVPLQLLC